MGYNQFSQAVQPADLYKPIDTNILAMGAKENYERAGKLAQNASLAEKNMFGVQTFGKDAEVLDELHRDFSSKIAELSKEGLDKPETLSRINTLISQYSSNPDVQAIHKRKTFYDNEKGYRRRLNPSSYQREVCRLHKVLRLKYILLP